MSRIYLDDAGHAPALPEVEAALRGVPAGNPSSPHAEGRAARAALDAARDRVARALGADRTQVTFTSSGTEAVNLALLGAAARLPRLGAARRLPRSGVIVTWAAEHQCVLAAARHLQAEGREVEVAPVDGAARADPGSIPLGAALVSISLANNEVGTVQPVTEVIRLAHELGALVHVDACAGLRWIDLPAGADLVSISGYKLGAGRGGALIVRDGLRLEPMLYGGPQEWGRRAGREDVAAAVALSVALDVCAHERASRSAQAMRQSALLDSTLKDLGGTHTGGELRLPNFATCAFPDRKGEDILMALDLAGIAASSGSACASGSLDPSHVLLAMGLDLAAALGSLRLTTGYDTTDEEIARARTIISSVLNRTRTHA